MTEQIFDAACPGAAESNISADPAEHQAASPFSPIQGSHPADSAEQQAASPFLPIQGSYPADSAILRTTSSVSPVQGSHPADSAASSAKDRSTGYVLRSARFLCAEALEKILSPGDRVVDATMGNGHDTLRLCQMVGESGHVDAFDVQAQAVENTRALLSENGVLPRAELHLTGHQHMAEYVTAPVRAVVFNLGWLPGGDKSITTHWDTTLPALRSALSLLEKLGGCIVCVYPGHAAGEEELMNIRGFLSSLKPREFNVLEQNFINANAGSPVCFQIQKQ